MKSRRLPMKRFLLLCISLIVVLTAGPEGTAFRGDETSRKQSEQIALPDVKRNAVATAGPSEQGTAGEEILILNSYHPGYAWSDDEQAGIIDVLQAKYENWIPIVEYLDLKRLPDGRHLAELKQLFYRKYQDKKFSVVIAMDNPALEFAIDNQEELFTNAPIVFCGINNYTPSLLKGRSNVTGIAEAIDLAGTIEVMLRLHPATREIFIPHDYTVSNLAVRREIEALIPRFRAKVRFRFSDPLTMEELLKELERLPKDSLVLEIGFITDKSGCTFGMTEAVMLFFEHSPVPVYSTYEQRLGFGIVGGKLLSARIHGTNAARIALKVLAGEKASAIPVVFESDSQFMFDYRVMSRFGISLSALPEGSTVINKPVSFYSAHRVVIQTAAGIIGVLIMVISLMTVIIIQRRRSAIALHASEAKYYDLYENAPDMYLSVDAKTATIIECNNTLVHTIGYTKEEMVGRSIFEMYHPDCKEAVKRLFQQFKATGEVHDAELKIMRKDGSIIDVSLNTSAVRDKDDKITHSRSIWRDITTRKKAENELRESEERLRFHSDNSPMAVVERNTDFIVTRWTGVAEKMFGWSAEESIGKPIMELCTVYEKDIPIVQNVIQRLSDGKSKYVVSSNRNYTKKGEVIHCEWYNSVLHDSAGKMISVMSQVLDITDRKQAEEALRANEERHRTILQTAMDGIWRVDPQGRLLEVNRTYCRMSGYSAEELLAMRIPDLEAVETEDNTAAHIQKIIAQGEDRFESRHRRKDGSIFNVEVSVQYRPTDGGQFVVFLRDITERKRAESEIHALARFPSENPSPVLRIARDGALLYANKAGLSQLPDWHLNVGQGAPSMMRDVVSETLNSGKARLLDLEHRGRLYSFFVAPIADADYANMYGRDITERRQAEEEMKKRENLLQKIFDVLPVGLWFADKEGKLLRGNPAGVKIWGAEPRVSLSELGIFKARRLPSGEEIAPEDWALAHTVRERVTVVDEMLEIDAFDRKKKVILNYTAPVLDDQGAIQGAIVVNLDITARKRTEDALRRSRAQLRAFAGRLQVAREEERTQIAREIHDELGGALTAIKIDFSLLARTVATVRDKELRESLRARMDDMTKLVDATMQTVRRIATGLRPGILDDLGLVAALEWQLTDFQKRTNIRCEFTSSCESVDLDGSRATALFRIAQEALTNVARHARATEVRIRLQADANAILLEVDDNGVGIKDEEIQSEKSLGLLGMRERALSFGGRLIITGRPGEGTKVAVESPPAGRGAQDQEADG